MFPGMKGVYQPWVYQGESVFLAEGTANVGFLAREKFLFFSLFRIVCRPFNRLVSTFFFSPLNTMSILP